MKIHLELSLQLFAWGLNQNFFNPNTNTANMTIFEQ